MSKSINHGKFKLIIVNKSISIFITTIDEFIQILSIDLHHSIFYFKEISYVLVLKSVTFFRQSHCRLDQAF